MNYNRNLFSQINRLTNEVTGSYRTYNPPEPPVVTDTVTITTEPTDITCYIGDTATLSIVAVSDDETATLSYQWQILNEETWLNVSGATESSYVVPTSGLKEDSYRCQVTSDKGGSATSTTATVTVEAVPVDTVTIVNQPSDTTVYVGGEFSFATVADTDDPTATLSYQWQIYADSTWTDISGATHATYVGTAPLTTGTADYRCVVTSTGGGTATTDSVTLTVEYDTVTISAQPQSASVIIGDTATLSVTATSNAQGATLSYQWQIKNGSTYDDISGATSSTYTVNTSTVGTERYRVVVTSDKGGTATSNYADVTVETETITITAQPQDTVIDYNYQMRYLTNTITATSNNPSATLSYQWQVYVVDSEYSLDGWYDINISSDGTTQPEMPYVFNQYGNKWIYHPTGIVYGTIGATATIRCIVTSSTGVTATSNTARVSLYDTLSLNNGDRIFITGLASGATIDGSHFAGKTINSNDAIAFSTMVNADVFDVAETNDGLTLYSLANNGYMNILPSRGVEYVSSGYTYYNNSQGNKSPISYGNYTAYGGTNISVVKKSDAKTYMAYSSGKNGIAFYTTETGAKTAFIRISDADYAYSVDFTQLNALPSEWETGGRTMLDFTSNGVGIMPTDYNRIDRCYLGIGEDGLALTAGGNYIVLANFYSNGGGDCFMRCDDTLSLVTLPIPHTGWYVLPLTVAPPELGSPAWEFFMGYNAYNGNVLTLRSLQIIKVN